MKKVIIVIAVILGTMNSAMAWNWGWSPAKGLFSSDPAKKENKPTTPQHYLEIIELLKKQLEQTQKTHQSITENRQLGVEQTDYTSFFLKNPELVYNEDEISDISASVKNILQKENTSIQESRDTINKRMQYAIVADKAVSLKTFQDAEDRFKQIAELIEKINTTADLKGIAELQARMKGVQAMIQNEATKLQMVNYSRNAEQALIKQKKYKRNMNILNSKNTKMPNIKFSR